MPPDLCFTMPSFRKRDHFMKRREQQVAFSLFPTLLLHCKIVGLVKIESISDNKSNVFKKMGLVFEAVKNNVFKSFVPWASSIDGMCLNPFPHDTF